MSTTRKAIPPALEPYLRLPAEASLILLTSTLGCSTTWLTSRFVGSLLGQAPKTEDGERDNAVVLVSWLRDESFWRGEIRRAPGLDTTKLSQTNTFAFIDGLTSLASSPNPGTALSSIEQTITTTIQTTQTPGPGKRITLILDAPDTLLATGATTAQALSLMILNLRSRVHSTILTLSADIPLISASTPSLGAGSPTPTPLETETAAFLVSQAHAARFVMGVRELETGSARDVSGVLRVTRGGDVDDWEDGEGENGNEVRETEALFLVGRDGGVKVFERGSGVG